jgi:hypothetical protein
MITTRALDGSSAAILESPSQRPVLSIRRAVAREEAAEAAPHPSRAAFRRHLRVRNEE